MSRISWFLFDGDKQPRRGTADIPPEMLDSWCPRETQICPAEAVAAAREMGAFNGGAFNADASAAAAADAASLLEAQVRTSLCA